MSMARNFEYNSEVDSLYIYGDNAENEEIAGSLAVGNMIFDISATGNLVGLEVDNASKVFQVPLNLFSKIEGAKLRTVLQGNIIILAFMIKLEQKEYNFSYMVSKNKIALNA